MMEGQQRRASLLESHRRRRVTFADKLQQVIESFLSGFFSLRFTQRFEESIGVRPILPSPTNKNSLSPRKPSTSSSTALTCEAPPCVLGTREIKYCREVGPQPASPDHIKTPENKDQILARLVAENKLLRQRVDQLLRVIYGIKSEQIDPAQLQLILQGLEPEKPGSSSGNSDDAPEGDQKPSEPKKKATKGKNHSRLKGLGPIEVIEQTIYPDDYEANQDQLELILLR